MPGRPDLCYRNTLKTHEDAPERDFMARTMLVSHEGRIVDSEAFKSGWCAATYRKYSKSDTIRQEHLRWLAPMPLKLTRMVAGVFSLSSRGVGSHERGIIDFRPFKNVREIKHDR